MKKFEVPFGGQTLSFETGRMAKQADGAVLVRTGDTIVLVTACGARKAKEDQDFFPLTVDYQEKTYAGGKIPGGYFKREGKATEKETLTSRLIDRPIRPLFPDGFYNEIQIIASVLSTDKEHNADVLAMNGASAALMLSGIPYLGPMAAGRVADINGKFVLNPTYTDLTGSSLDLVVAITELGIVMIEAGAQIVTEERFLQALEFAQTSLKPLLELQKKMKREAGKETWKIELASHPADLVEKVRTICSKEMHRINAQERSKEARSAAMDALYDKATSELVNEEAGITEKQIAGIFHELEYDEVRHFILNEKIRTDGRQYDEIRPITCEAGVLPRVHGSALFTRGQTQSLGVATLGTSRDEQIIDAIEGDLFKSFMLHYNFPPFSVGEIKPMRGPGRREIGHGALAERGLRPAIPSKEEFPYTIRVVSDILESNGSSSMASVCSGTLALMDAGVPLKAPVSGIAMGLVMEKGKVAVLSDIAGVEDHLGDMDFKVTGTSTGVTAVQLDIKLKESLTIETLAKALDQARRGRLHILEKMSTALSAPRKELSAFAPRITTIKVDPDKIREIIGPGGKMIRKITADSGAQIEVEDDGTVRIASSDEASKTKAISMITGITEEAEVGKIYDATVKRIMNFGAFCEILPGKEGLVHISELAEQRVNSVEDVVKIGDAIRVKVIEIDSMGRINLSKKQSANDGPPVVQKRDRGENGKGSGQKKPWRN